MGFIFTFEKHASKPRTGDHFLAWVVLTKYTAFFYPNLN